MNPSRQRFAWLLTLSLVLHLGVLGWWSTTSLTERPTAAEYQVALISERTTFAPAEETAAVAETTVPDTPPEPERRDPAIPEAQPEAQEEQSLSSPTVEMTRSLPRGWRNRKQEAADVDAARTDPALPFHPGRAAAVVQRRAEQRRGRLLARRGVQTRGLDPDDYNAMVGSRDHIKTEKGCFDLVEERASPGLARRWWMTSCGELLVSPFELAPLLTDRLGRAVSDP